MLRLRPYQKADADEILSWCQDERAFYQWSAGVLGQFPITQQAFSFVESLMPFTAFDETGIVGFFTLRNPNDTPHELRFGFVIVKPDLRGKGCGKEMLRSALKFVFEIYRAERASLGVFENNLPAYFCYRSVGFSETDSAPAETYCILGEEWKCRELVITSEMLLN